jgi:hypothetical protein
MTTNGFSGSLEEEELAAGDDIAVFMVMRTTI